MFWQAGISKLNSSLSIATANFGKLLYNNFARTTQKTQPLYCWKGVVTAPFHSNGNYSIATSIFVAAGIRLASRCLAMNVCSDFAIPAFGRHVIMFNFKCMIQIIREFIIIIIIIIIY
jgi:hypothetical protein